MPRYVDLDNPKIIRGERDRFGLVVYHIPPDTPCLNLAERKQEAIDALEKIIADHPLDGYEDACELITALKAILSAQPELVKESGDLVNDLVKDDTISRQAALKTIGLIKSKRDKISVFSDDFDIISRTETMIAISNLLPAQPERKKGKWIHISDGYVDIYECNQCGDTEDYERNFCHNCGADMRGEQDE